MDLPVVLETMLRTIATKHNVNSWSIYPEKDTIVTFKIKFACSEETAMPQHYKKKSISQLKRDNTRASVWRSSQRSGHFKESAPPTNGSACKDVEQVCPTTVASDDTSTRVLTRSMSRRVDSAVEIFRRNSSSSEVEGLDVSLPSCIDPAHHLSAVASSTNHGDSSQCLPSATRQADISADPNASHSFSTNGHRG